MTKPTIAIVTGAVGFPQNVYVLSLKNSQNRGIGKAICQLVLSRTDISPSQLFATSRKGENLGLSSGSGNTKLVYPKLDISNRESVKALTEDVKSQGYVDVLINNAGVNLDAQYGPENVRKTLDVNYRGTLEMCQTFIPLLSPRGRIVNLSSVAATLKPYSEAIRHRFRNAEMSLGELDQLIDEYEKSVRTKTEASSGFVGPGRAYAFSKSCVNAMTRILARDNPGLTINACCPGWVKTDMGLLIGRAPKTPAEGAKVPVRLAFGDIGGVTGKYWANSSVRSREEGEVQEW